MLSVVIGGSGSGKSEFAENMAVKLNNGSLIYIATMEPFGEEGRKRIKRHRQMREKKNFETVECYRELEILTLSEDSTVLLECLSNLAANEMFQELGTKEEALAAMKRGIISLRNQGHHLIIVTNNIFEDGFLYDKETMAYMELLGEINKWICREADLVYEVIHGIPILLKGNQIN